MSWKKDAPERRFISKKDWFADMKRAPVEGAGKSGDTMRIRTKVCSTVNRASSFFQVVESGFKLEGEIRLTNI